MAAARRGVCGPCSHDKDHPYVRINRSSSPEVARISGPASSPAGAAQLILPFSREIVVVLFEVP